MVWPFGSGKPKKTPKVVPPRKPVVPKKAKPRRTTQNPKRGNKPGNT